MIKLIIIMSFLLQDEIGILVYEYKLENSHKIVASSQEDAGTNKEKIRSWVYLDTGSALDWLCSPCVGTKQVPYHRAAY